MNQKKLLAASVAAACLAMTTSALAADYSNHTGTADGTTLAGHLNSTTDAINFNQRHLREQQTYL